MKKIREEIKLKGSGGIFDLLDNEMKVRYNITDDEYDFICENVTDEEMEIFAMPGIAFAERRKALEIRNKYLKMYEVEKEKLI